MTLLERAAALLAANTQTAVKDGRTYTFTVPSTHQYPFQWFWDSCFHAIVWSLVDPERAREELRGLLAWQERSGFIPHVVFWNQERVSRSPFRFHFLESQELGMVLPWGRKPRTTRHIQPPVIAQAVERVVGASGEGSFLFETLPALEAYYRWLAGARDPDRDGLISIIAQFESGLDYSPAYDPPGAAGAGPLELIVRTRWPELENKVRFRFDLDRIFRRASYHQEDVLVNAVYGQGLSALARLAARAGRADLEAWASAQGRLLTDALEAKCYDPDAGLFWNLVGPDERPSRVPTVISLMPLVLEELPRPIVERLVGTLTDESAFWPDYPVPSVAIREPSFVPGILVDGERLIWRGPLSMNTNWFIAHGLRLHGYGDLADDLAARSRELAERGGFNEFYDPLTGEPVGAERFGWGTLVVDL